MEEGPELSSNFPWHLTEHYSWEGGEERDVRRLGNGEEAQIERVRNSKDILSEIKSIH